MVSGSVEHGANEVGQDSISCPSRSESMVSKASASILLVVYLLSEDTEAAVASESVTRAGFLEQRTVIPPALVRAVHVQ